MGGNLREQLHPILGSAYQLGEELTGGGMSRVFVATETALGRRVVVKVLPPDVALEISAERFRQEIQLAASLQHPNVVPVLSTGTDAGILYYTMPFIEGESLRALLQRVRQLPLEDALRIAGEVAEALDYAHRRGIIHRDIKPENILLEDGHAVVTDFGIARALSHSTTASSLTATGVTLGTPTYMSPEQASAAPDLDGRSDLYSLGCVLYEMLAGEPPFTGPTPAAVIAKRLSGEAPSVRVLRPNVPMPVDQAVARALALVPADRFASAKDFARALGVSGPNLTFVSSAPSTPAAPRLVKRRSPLRWIAVGGGIAAGLVLAVLLGRGTRTAPSVPVDQNIVAVLPFRVSGADPSLAFLREGMVDLLAAKLTGEGGPRAADPRSVLSAWRQGMDAGDGDPGEEAARAIAQRLGAGRVLLGGIVGNASRIVIHASLASSLPRGRSPVEANVEGPPEQLPVLIDQLTAQLLAGEAGEGGRLSALTSTSLPALRDFLEGQSAYRRGRFDEAVRHFERALERDSSFVLAAVGLFSAAYWTPNTEPFERGKRLAWTGRARLSARDAAFVAAWVGPRYPAPASFAETLAGWQHAVEVSPDRPEPWFELGDVYFHFGPLLGVEEPWRRAKSAFDRALALDSAFAAPLGHLVELAAAEGDTARARLLGARYLAQDSTADAADYVRWRLAVARQDDRQLAALRQRLATVSTLSLRRIVGLGQVSGVGLDDVRRAADALRLRGTTPSEARRIHAELHHLALNTGRPTEARAALRAYAEVEPYPGASDALAVLSAVFAGGDSGWAAAAAERLSRAMGNVGSDPDAPRAYRCALGFWRIDRGDLAAAGDASAWLERAGGMVAGEGSLDATICGAALRVQVAAHQGRADAGATQRLDDALDRIGSASFGGSAIESGGRMVLARAHEQRGDLAAALATIRRRAYHHYGATYLAAMLREEGRIAERAGDAPGAARAYRQFLALRHGAEPAAAAEVESVRAALERLAAADR